MAEFIRRFAEIDLGAVAQVGGKGANLGEMTRAALPVPPGFVVGTDGFRDFLDRLALDDRLAAIERLAADDLSALSAASAVLRRDIEEAPFPAGIATAIAAAHNELCADPRHPLAVRSSATGEDSEAASFAGLQDTYLWVRGADAVAAHVRKCWSSLYNTEAVAYRRKMGLPERGVAMAVVVQKMVDARCSGVMFTRSPTSGDRSVVVIEGSYGLGSCIVSGEVTPDRFVVSKVTGLVADRAISQKTVQHVPEMKGGIRVDEVPAALQGEPALSDAEIAALAETAKTIERHYGRPQDIEWAIARDDGKLYLLQSRPETYWSKRDAAPVSKPAANAMEHVFAAFGGTRR